MEQIILETIDLVQQRRIVEALSNLQDLYNLVHNGELGAHSPRRNVNIQGPAARG